MEHPGGVAGCHYRLLRSGVRRRRIPRGPGPAGGQVGVARCSRYDSVEQPPGMRWLREGRWLTRLCSQHARGESRERRPIPPHCGRSTWSLHAIPKPASPWMSVVLETLWICGTCFKLCDRLLGLVAARRRCSTCGSSSKRASKGGASEALPQVSVPIRHSEGSKRTEWKRLCSAIRHPLERRFVGARESGGVVGGGRGG